MRFNYRRRPFPCRECGEIIAKPKPNQHRCHVCILKNPSHGAHVATVKTAIAIQSIRDRLNKTVKRWKVEDGLDALKEKFPDIYEQYMED